MSLYNALFGVNPMAPVLLAALGTEVEKIPRFRDIYLVEEDGKRHIVLYTRTGGGNRDYYDSLERRLADDPTSGKDGPFNEDLRQLPGFMRDEDDGFDATYAHFHFAVPETFGPLIDMLVETVKMPSPPQERWAKLIDDLTAKRENPDTARALAVGKSVMEQLFPRGTSS